jgi:hypothetical protein
MNPRRRGAALNALSAAAAAQDVHALAALLAQHVGEASVLRAALAHVLRAVGEAQRAGRELPLRTAKVFVAAGVEALRTHARGAVDLQASVVTQLLSMPMQACVAHIEELSADIVSSGGLEPLLAAMRRDPADVGSAGCLVLRALAVPPATRAAALRAGAVTVVLDLCLAARMPHALATAHYLALAALLHDAPPEALAAARGAGALRAVTRLMRAVEPAAPDSAALLTPALRAMWHLASERGGPDREHLSPEDAARAVAAVLGAMHAHADALELQGHACRALCGLWPAAFAHPGVPRAAAAAAVTAAMRAHAADKPLHMAAFHALERLACKGQPGGCYDADASASAVLSALRSHAGAAGEDAQHLGLITLRNMVISSVEGVRSRAVRRGVAAAAAAAAAAHPTLRGVVCAGLVADLEETHGMETDDVEEAEAAAAAEEEERMERGGCDRAGCGARAGGDAAVKLRLCAACRGARYCSVACQRTDWAAHKAACRAAAAAAAAA